MNSLVILDSRQKFSKQDIINALKKKGAIKYRIDALSMDWQKGEKTPNQYLLDKGGEFHKDTGTNKLLVELIKYFNPKIAVTEEKYLYSPPLHSKKTCTTIW